MLYEGAQYFVYKTHGVTSLAIVKVPSGTTVGFGPDGMLDLEKLAAAACLRLSSVFDFKPRSGDVLLGIWKLALKIRSLHGPYAIRGTREVAF